jgi:hypothetical protein
MRVCICLCEYVDGGPSSGVVILLRGSASLAASGRGLRIGSGQAKGAPMALALASCVCVVCRVSSR